MHRCVQACMKSILDCLSVRRIVGITGRASICLITNNELTMALQVMGINVQPLLAVGGVSGIAIGFGAQSVSTNAITGINLVSLAPSLAFLQKLFTEKCCCCPQETVCWSTVLSIRLVHEQNSDQLVLLHITFPSHFKSGCLMSRQWLQISDCTAAASNKGVDRHAAS